MKRRIQRTPTYHLPHYLLCLFFTFYQKAYKLDLVLVSKLLIPSQSGFHDSSFKLCCLLYLSTFIFIMYLVLDLLPMKGVPGPGNLYLPTCPLASFQVLPQKSRVWCWSMCGELFPSSLPRQHHAFSICFALSCVLNVKHLVPNWWHCQGRL